MLKIYSIFDRKTSSYRVPFFSAEEAYAVRAFIATFAQDGEYQDNPQDFELWQIGTFNPQNGELLQGDDTNSQHEKLMLGLDAMHLLRQKRAFEEDYYAKRDQEVINDDQV